jgi:hypothetical protein
VDKSNTNNNPEIKIKSSVNHIKTSTANAHQWEHNKKEKLHCQILHFRFPSLLFVTTYMKKNIAESDCGVACQRKINNVGKNMLGCFTAPQSCFTCCFVLSIKPEPETKMLLWPDKVLDTGASFTSTATADVNSGKKAVTLKTNLHLICQ